MRSIPRLGVTSGSSCVEVRALVFQREEHVTRDGEVPCDGVDAEIQTGVEDEQKTTW